MPLASPALLEATPTGMAVTTTPEVSYRTREVFGPAYQNNPFTQIVLSSEDFESGYGPKRPIRITCVRKYACSSAVMSVIGAAFPFCLVMETRGFPFDHLKPGSEEKVRLLLDKNFAVFPFADASNFRLLGINIPLTGSAIFKRYVVWAVRDVFICGESRPELRNEGHSLSAWRHAVVWSEPFRKAMEEARERIAEVMETVSLPAGGIEPEETAPEELS